MSQKLSFFPTRKRERSFFEVSLDEETTILLFREFSSAKVLFHFSRASRHLLSVHPPEKKTWNASDDSTQKARHPRRDPREKTNAQTKKRPHGNASGCLKKEKSTEPWRSPRRARSARERRRCRERKIVQCRKGIIDIV